MSFVVNKSRSKFTPKIKARPRSSIPTSGDQETSLKTSASPDLPLHPQAVAATIAGDPSIIHPSSLQTQPAFVITTPKSIEAVNRTYGNCNEVVLASGLGCTESTLLKHSGLPSTEPVYHCLMRTSDGYRIETPAGRNDGNRAISDGEVSFNNLNDVDGCTWQESLNIATGSYTSLPTNFLRSADGNTANTTKGNRKTACIEHVSSRIRIGNLSGTVTGADIITVPEGKPPNELGVIIDGKSFPTCQELSTASLEYHGATEHDANRFVLGKGPVGEYNNTKIYTIKAQSNAKKVDQSLKRKNKLPVEIPMAKVQLGTEQNHEKLTANSGDLMAEKQKGINISGSVSTAVRPANDVKLWQSRPSRKPKETRKANGNMPCSSLRAKGLQDCKRKRMESPPDGEHQMIEASIMKMKDLCQDPLIGKKSKRFVELANMDWTEVVRDQRDALAEKEASRGTTDESLKESSVERLAIIGQRPTRESDLIILFAVHKIDITSSIDTPQFRIVDGQVVLDEQSLRVSRREREPLNEEYMDIIIEDQNNRLVNSSTYSKREVSEKWESTATALFYEALSMFGTDFECISKMFPGRSRRQIKNKFNLEERKYPQKITLALRTRIPIDIRHYSAISCTQFREVNEFEAELRNIKAEHKVVELNMKAHAAAMDQEHREQADAAIYAEREHINPQPRKRQRKQKGGLWKVSMHEEVVGDIVDYEA